MDLATLRERQGWILEQKIDHAVGAVEQFKARTGRPLYVSFSGGKDSTDIALSYEERDDSETEGGV